MIAQSLEVGAGLQICLITNNNFNKPALVYWNVHHSPLLAPPEIPPQRGEEKDKPLIWEGVGGGVLVSHLTDNRYSFAIARYLQSKRSPTLI